MAMTAEQLLGRGSKVSSVLRACAFFALSFLCLAGMIMFTCLARCVPKRARAGMRSNQYQCSTPAVVPMCTDSFHHEEVHDGSGELSLEQRIERYLWLSTWYRTVAHNPAIANMYFARAWSLYTELERLTRPNYREAKRQVAELIQILSHRDKI